MARTVYTGFDSAWTRKNRGAIASIIVEDGASSLEGPEIVSFEGALDHIRTYGHGAAIHALAIDQPLVVTNATGRRPVESAVSHVIGRYRSAIQPANQSRKDMFGEGAPIWPFLNELAQLGFQHTFQPAGANASGGKCFFEVYPALGNLGLFPEFYARGVVPRYNPHRRKTFTLADWQSLCSLVSAYLEAHGVQSPWLQTAQSVAKPRKAQQDQLDALICLCHATHWGTGASTVVLGDMSSGYMVVPSHDGLAAELRRYAVLRGVRCSP